MSISVEHMWQDHPKVCRLNAALHYPRMRGSIVVRRHEVTIGLALHATPLFRITLLVIKYTAYLYTSFSYFSWKVQNGTRNSLQHMLANICVILNAILNSCNTNCILKQWVFCCFFPPHQLSVSHGYIENWECSCFINRRRLFVRRTGGRGLFTIGC